MNAVRQQSCGLQNAEFVPALDNTHVVRSPAALRVRCRLRGVHVKTRSELRRDLAALSKRRVAERERRVHPEKSAQPVVACVLAVLKKRTIFLNALMRNLGAVAVGDLVAKATAQAGLARRLGNTEQAARHGTGT